MIQSLAVPRDDSELFLEDTGGSGALLRIHPEQNEVTLNPDDVKAIHAWTASWLADRYGSEATEDSGDLPKEWRPT